MAFSQLVKDQALARAGGRCECTRLRHGHIGRCLKRGPFHFHHKTALAVGGYDGLSNCEVLCVSCHKLTQSYGRS